MQAWVFQFVQCGIGGEGEWHVDLKMVQSVHSIRGQGRGGEGERRIWRVWTRRGGRGVGTRPWWLALLACGGAYWPLALEPSAMTSRHPHYCGHPHCRKGGMAQGHHAGLFFFGGGVPTNI